MTKQDILHHIPFYNNSAFIYGKKCLCRSCRIHHHMPEVQREVSSIWDYAQIRLKSLLRQVKEESEKVDLKLNIQKTKIMASSPISSVQSLSHVQLFATHESQHARPPCPSPTPGVHSDSHPSSRWCHQPSHPLSSPSPPAPNPSQHQSLFQWVNSSHEVTKVLEFQL